MIPVRFLLLLLFLLQTSHPNSITYAKVWDAETLLSLKQVSSYSVSPNGKWIISSVSESKEDKSGFKSRLWLINTESGEKTSVYNVFVTILPSVQP